MPELSRFYGIVIRMYFGDHSPPHFHAIYGGARAVVEIGTLSFLDSGFPPRARGLVIEWATIHQNELLDAFHKVQALEAPDPIAPLD